jgi:hypothetical protein
MTRLFIEDLEMDLSQGLSNQITYAVDDLYNMDSKSTSFTKTIILPATAKNNELLGNIFELTNSNFYSEGLPNVGYNFNASKSARARIEENGLQVIKGSLRLNEIVYENNRVVEYEVIILGELGGFVSALGNNRLEDLDFSAYNMVYNNTNIVASWDNANSGLGVYFPLMDVGQVSEGGLYGTAKKDYQYQAFRPALHAAEYMDKIITSAGYTYESSFFSTDFFKRLIIPHNQKNLTKSGTTLANTTIDAGNYNIQSTVPVPFTFSGLTATDFVLDTRPGLKYTGANPITVNGRVKIDGTYNFDVTNIPATGFNIYIYKFTSATSGLSIVASQFVDGNAVMPVPLLIDLNATGVSMATNDVLYIDVSTADPDGCNIDITDAFFKIDSQSPTLINVNLGDDLVINDALPKGIFQKDFFASILKMYNLFVTEDRFTDKHLIITPFVDFYDTTPSSYIDWSDKIDRGKQIRVKPMSEVNSRFYEFKYKQDNDYYNENYRKKYSQGYGDRIYDNALEFAKESEAVEVIFASSVLVGYTGEDKVVPTIFKKTNDVEERQDFVIRILQAKKITGVTSWDILNGVTIVSSNTNYPYAGHFDDPDVPSSDLCFGIPKELFFVLSTGDISNNLFNAFYSSYFAEITDKDSRLLSCMVKLTDVDVFNIDFSKFYFIDGGLFRLQKLIDYTPDANEPTKAELLLAINTTY